MIDSVIFSAFFAYTGLQNSELVKILTILKKLKIGSTYWLFKMTYFIFLILALTRFKNRASGTCYPTLLIYVLHCDL